MWFDPGLAGLFITSTLLHLGEDINLLVVSNTNSLLLIGIVPRVAKQLRHFSTLTDGHTDRKVPFGILPRVAKKL
jgi:hypothetical protein